MSAEIKPMPTKLTTEETAALRDLAANLGATYLTRPHLRALFEAADEAARLREAIEVHRIVMKHKEPMFRADFDLYAALKETP